MHISFASKTDESAVRSMWKYCFHDSDRYIDMFFGHVYNVENTIVAYKENIPIGSVQLFPHMLSDGKTDLNAMYIGGLCVLPSYRGQGIAKELMRFAENYIKNENVTMSFLVPFSFGFYRQIGYECFSYLSEFSGPITALKSFMSGDKIMYPCSIAPIEAYRKFTSRFSLFAKREASFYENEIFPLCTEAYCYSLENNAGYLLYTISENCFKVLEIVYENETALKNILGFIYAHKAELDTFCIRTSAEGALRKILCENTIRETRFPHAMYKSFSEIKMPETMQIYINMLGWF